MMIAPWEYSLVNSSDLSRIGELKTPDASLTLGLNLGGNLGLSIDLTDDEAYQVKKHSTAVIASRRGVAQWSGPVTTINMDGASNKMAIGCVGWLTEFSSRFVRRTGDHLQFNEIDAGTIIKALVDSANEQRDGPITNNAETGTLRPTHVTLETANIETSQPRTRKYDRDANILQSIDELTAVEAGVDISLHPLTRKMSVHYSEVIPGSTVRGLGRDRPSVLFSYNVAPFNLLNASRREDGGKARNYHESIGDGGIRGQSANIEAIDDMGIMVSAIDSLSGVRDANLLAAYSTAEVAVLARGETVYSLEPKPWVAEAGVPEPLVDYGIGDVIRFRAEKGAMRIRPQEVRIFGMTISQDSNGIERVTNLQTSATG